MEGEEGKKRLNESKTIRAKKEQIAIKLGGIKYGIKADNLLANINNIDTIYHHLSWPIRYLYSLTVPKTHIESVEKTTRPVSMRYNIAGLKCVLMVYSRALYYHIFGVCYPTHPPLIFYPSSSHHHRLSIRNI